MEPTKEQETPSQPSTTALPRAPQLLGDAIRLYRERWKIFVGIVLPVFLLDIVGVFVFSQENLLSPLIVFQILSVFIGFLSWIALAAVLVDPLSSSLHAYRKALGIFFPFACVVAFGYLTVFGGLMLFIIPGIIIALLLSVAPYVFLAENKRGLAALAASWEYARGNLREIFWRFLFLWLVLGLISLAMTFFTYPFSPSLLFEAAQSGVPPLAPLIPAAIGARAVHNFILYPIEIIYVYGIYMSLRRRHSESPSAEEARVRRNIKIFAGLGVFSIVALVAIAGVLLSYFLSSLLSPTGTTGPEFQPRIDMPYNGSGAALAEPLRFFREKTRL